MKRITLIFWVLLMISSTGFAQSLSLKFGDEVVSNDSVFYSGTVTDDLLELHIKVKNLTDKDIEVKVRKTEISLVENSVNTFCWGSCFMPHVYTSPAPITIRANGTDFNSFAGDYEPSGMEGTSIISYTFFNVQNEEDSVMVTAFYQVGTSGIADFNYNSSLVKVFPNPIVDMLNIQFQSEIETPYSIRLLGLNGQVLKEFVAESRAREHSFSMANLSSAYAILEITNTKGLNIRKKVFFSK